VGRNGIATVFPQSIGMAATWDPDLIYQEADVISTEARAKHHENARNGQRGIYQGLTFWSPNINIFRDPRWGRGQETYGEDPYLTGRIGVAFVKGLQGNDPKYFKVISTAKHYAVHSGPESSRHKFDAWCSEKDLFETYLPAFEALIREGKAYSVMGAYNRFWNQPCCASDLLLDEILRKKWGFEGYVVSDCGAIWDIFNGHELQPDAEKASVLGVKAGCDLTCGTEYQSLVNAVKAGYISEAEIDNSLKRLFTARFMLGMFDPDSMVAWARIPYSANDNQEHRKLARKAAQESIVLLKNENNTLPLSLKTGTIAVIGPYADKVNVLLGNYNGTPSAPVTFLQGITNRAGKSIKVTLSQGIFPPEDVFQFSTLDLRITKPALESTSHGLNTEYFSNPYLKGVPVLNSVDTNMEHHYRMYSPRPEIPVDSFSIRWTGFISVTLSGFYEIGALSDDKCRIWIDNKLIADNWDTIKIWTVRSGKVYLEAGKDCPVRIEYAELSGWSGIDFVWRKIADDKIKQNMMDQAVSIAGKSDVIIFCGGISPDLEGEEMDVKIDGFSGGDRTHMDLPADQQRLLENLHATGKPVILVLTNGSALSINWVKENIPAIVETWYPGEEGGNALADVLFGDYNPAGRLPVTFYKSVKDLPPFEDYSMSGRTYRYFKGDPLFPFGFGLSYTMFDYKTCQTDNSVYSGTDTIRLKVILKNTGERDGDEVVQVYSAKSSSIHQHPLKSLVGFCRLNIRKGQETTANIIIPAKNLRIYDPSIQDYIVAPGRYFLNIGPSSENILLRQELEIRE
jgi:beta-glucosidase